MHYDVIGDIHGHADKLVALLTKLGYRERLGAWRRPERTAIFVGDFIDRGPGQLATIDIVRPMIDAGSARAVMGNHEFNAIAFSIRDEGPDGQHLRRRTEKNRRQHAAFLAEVECDSPRHRELVDWFLTLPLWLDLPEFRVVHACWHAQYMAQIAPQLDDGRRLDRELVVAASRHGSAEHRIVEALLKGLEIDLPVGQGFDDKDGHPRTSVRTRWWGESGLTYRDAALLDGEARNGLPESPVPAEAFVRYDDDKPVFFGHYWWTGAPKPMSGRIACVDYSAGKGGPLVAYRWNGESELMADHFVGT